MAVKVTNNASTTLAANITNSATSLTVATGTGSEFPSPTSPDVFYATLSNAADTTVEIVKVTARSTDTFTIVRAQDALERLAGRGMRLLRLVAGVVAGESVA